MSDADNAAVVRKAVEQGWQPHRHYHRGTVVSDLLLGHGDPYGSTWTLPEAGPRECVRGEDSTELMLAAEAARVYLATPR